MKDTHKLRRKSAAPESIIPNSLVTVNCSFRKIIARIAVKTGYKAVNGTASSFN